jgi:hypothetical protein
VEISCLRWTGSPDDWAIGIYKGSTEQYSENEFPWSSGPLTGTPEQGIDETLALYAGPRQGSNHAIGPTAKLRKSRPLRTGELQDRRWLTGHQIDVQTLR